MNTYTRICYVMSVAHQTISILDILHIHRKLNRHLFAPKDSIGGETKDCILKSERTMLLMALKRMQRRALKPRQR